MRSYVATQALAYREMVVTIAKSFGMMEKKKYICSIARHIHGNESVCQMW